MHMIEAFHPPSLGTLTTRREARRPSPARGEGNTEDQSLTLPARTDTGRRYPISITAAIAATPTVRITSGR